MGDFLVRSAFTAKTPTGSRMMKTGEALRLSTTQAIPLLSCGLLVDTGTGLSLLDKYEGRVAGLVKELDYSREEAQEDASQLVLSCFRRHESLKRSYSPSDGFLAEVKEFNRTVTGKNPINKEQSSTGVGEWAGYTCNIGSGCSHGCRYCYAVKMAVRFGRVVDVEAWKEEALREVATSGCKKYDSTIMFPTTHDITPAYLPAYRVHLYNLLDAGNQILVVSKPHLDSIQAICSEFSSYRDNIMFRFTIGGLNAEVMQHWEPRAPLFEERFQCLKHAFEQGYTTSVSAEPMLGSCDEAVKLYYLLEPYITKEIWFGKMNNIGGFRSNADPEVARHATELIALQADGEIMKLVGKLNGLPKVQWKDSIKAIIAKEKEK